MNISREIIQLRQKLHSSPELSGNERTTAKIIKDFLVKYNPDRIYDNIYGNAIVAEINSQKPGPTLFFRCDMDAVPVQEINDLEYRSQNYGTSHACGHDGHMAIVCGLAVRLSEKPINKGKVLLFYQPSEENGEGAKGSIEGLKRIGIVPDYAFAIHNLPGYKKHSIVLGKYTFSAASKGVIIKLYGKTSHAAYLENGINPALAIAEIINSINAIEKKVFNDFVLATIVKIGMGDKAFGVSPGDAEILITLRAYDNNDIKKLSSILVDLVTNIAKKNKLIHSIDYSDDFPASVCDKELTDLIEYVSKGNSNSVIFLKEPNRWSEDFAHFSLEFKALIFGIGAGEDHPHLHTAEYNFPDEIIETGISTFDRIIDTFLR